MEAAIIPQAHGKQDTGEESEGQLWNKVGTCVLMIRMRRNNI